MSSSSINQKLSIYIPRVAKAITAEYMTEVMKTLRIGNVARVDLTASPSSKQSSAYIHFAEWYITPEVAALQSKILNPKLMAKIVYSDPWFWIMLPNTNPLSVAQKAEAEAEYLAKTKLADAVAAAAETAPVPIKPFTQTFASVVYDSSVADGNESPPPPPPPSPAITQTVLAVDDMVLEYMANEANEEYETGVTVYLNEELRIVIQDLQERLAATTQMAVTIGYEQEMMNSTLDGRMYQQHLVIENQQQAINYLLQKSADEEVMESVV